MTGQQSSVRGAKSARRKSAAQGAQMARRAKPKAAADIAPIAYKDSLGALAMRDTAWNVAERNHYNYVDPELRGPAFAELDPKEHVSLKHHSAMLLYGMRVWAQLAELHQESAALLRATENPYDHPLWKSIFRHARNANERSDGDNFLAACLGCESGLSNFDWMSTPEHIRAEWTLYSWRGTGGIAPQAADADTLGRWFSDNVYQRMCLFGLATEAITASDFSALGHYLTLLKTIAPDVHSISGDVSTPDAFLVARLREAHIRHFEGVDQAEAYLASVWGVLSATGQNTRSPMAHLHRMRTVYNRRLANAEAMADAQRIVSVQEDWRTLLKEALASYEGGLMR
ncbi:hypothetical protein [Hyphobacterium marinum]|uniref:Uncharacterized protein n=1 Tax=Hyphobacterium marinum TaxID=3116574 RepID=A0ABU7LY43_9PROT|nr:hypothetical protein [Hyphobacterium sp. Y6023]MEE2566473.1 hypothetical protein [Hyphobacterium sp. Y6023]